ncbi:tetratricopeptide repeat protein, partial [Salmonella enterica]|uniref:tetratricopeptide repeat protein n=1 Tax=Salmonella enterica TaxID=28901 RepID=UPI003CF87896
KGILHYYLNRDFSKAIDILSQIDLDSADINTSIEILNSIAIIYYEESDYETAQSYFNRAISSVNETVSHTIKVKLYFS